jgi:G3E family GTPase
VKKKIYFFNGALGSGKTTLINQLILSGILGKFFIIENEISNFSVDNLCLHVDPKQVKVLAGECVCCSDSTELVKILEKVSFENYEYVVIESSGVASLNSLLAQLINEKGLEEKYEIGGCVFVVDALGLERTNVTDLELADFVVVTKSDEVKTFTQTESLDNFIKVEHPDLSFILKKKVEDTLWIQELLKVSPKSFREWAVKVNDEKHHGQNFVKVLTGRDLFNFDPERVFGLMKDKKIYRVKGFYTRNGLFYHVEMTPELKKVEVLVDFNNTLGVVVIGGNKFLLDEFVSHQV